MVPTISEIYGISKPVHPYIEEINKFPDSPLFPSYVGIEVEVEAIKNEVNQSPAIWVSKEDGSLRNYGIEYVSYPTPSKKCPSIFSYLHKKLKENNIPSFSVRTSTHIHIDVTDMSIPQIQSFLLLYLCFEDVLFNIVGEERRENIFCVPLVDTEYVEKVRAIFLSSLSNINFNKLLLSWDKYTGINLKPISSFGTIEFRHLKGTDDPLLFKHWLSVILKLKKKAMENSCQSLYKTIEALNTNSEYHQFAMYIFEEKYQVLPTLLEEKMENCVSHIKEWFSNIPSPLVDQEKFISSSFFRILKVKKKEDNTERINELENRLQFLLIEYGKNNTVARQEEIRKEYVKLERELKKLKSNNLTEEW